MSKRILARHILDYFISINHQLYFSSSYEGRSYVFNGVHFGGISQFLCVIKSCST